MASRSRRRVAAVCAGLALLGCAAAVRYVAVPQLTRLPGDFSGSQQAVGTYSGLNPGALAGKPGPAVLKRTPITVTRTVAAQSADGGTAILTLSSAVKGRNLSVPKLRYRYAVDRSTHLAIPAPAGATGVTRAEGVVVTLPHHPSPDGGYRYWDQFTQKSYPLTYSGTEDVAGRRTLVFTADAAGRVANPKILGFPATLDRDQARDLAPVLAAALPASLRERLPKLLELMPDRVPVEYRATTRTTIYADAELGVPLKARVQQSVSTRISGVKGAAATASTVDVTTKKDAIAATADLVSAAAFKLWLAGTGVPSALGLLGVLLLVGGLVAVQRARRDPWVWVREMQRHRRRKQRAEKLAWTAGWGAGVVTGTGMAAATRAGEMVSHVVDEVKAEIRGDDVAEVIGEELGKIDGAAVLEETCEKRPVPAEPTGSDDVVWQGPALLPEDQAEPLPSRAVSG